MEPVTISLTHIKHIENDELKYEEIKVVVERREQSNEYFNLSVRESEVLVERLKEKLEEIKSKE